MHSEKLTRMLTAHRTAAIQAAMTDRPKVALVALVHRLAMQVFGNRFRSSRIVQTNVEETHLKPDAEHIEQSRAAIALGQKHQYWQERIETAGQEGKELLAWLLEQSQQDLLELLAFSTAASINTVSSRENTPSKEVATLMSALNLDMPDWWEATPENYLSHVSKDRILSVVTEVDQMNVFNVGINWFLKGHNSKFTFDYQNRPIFNTNGSGDIVKTSSRGQFVLQYQIAF